jgi:hypothetical protein
LGHEGQAVDARRRLAALKGYEDDARKQEAALWLGEHLSRTDPDLARAYLWNAMTWSYNSGNGDLRGRVTRAIDDLRHARGGDRATPGDTLPRGETPRSIPCEGLLHIFAVLLLPFDYRMSKLVLLVPSTA